MAKRLTRAKLKVRDAGIPYRVPAAAHLAERLDGVLTAIYLLANEGYVGNAGDRLNRPALSGEALRLATLVGELMPDEPEVNGLRALLIMHRARAATRIDGDGVLIPLEDQDRRRWDRTMINTAIRLLVDSGRLNRVGPYQLQAMIAGCHLTAERPEDTDWTRIVTLYDTLPAIAPSPVVRLNRIIAIAMRDGPEVGLRLINRAAPGEIPDDHLLAATQADLLRRLGRRREAGSKYRMAIGLTANHGEQRYLIRRLNEVS